MQKIPSREQIYCLFDKIAATYDILNRFFSFGLDSYWRRKLCNFLPPEPHLSLLDCATGTGEQLLTFCQKCPSIKKAIGVDFSEKMLSRAKKKITQFAHPSIHFQKADVSALPFEDNRFDCVSITFGLRNLIDLAQGLQEMHRVLKPKGRFIALEFSLPSLRSLRALQLFYLRTWMARVGGWIAKEPSAYRYLHQTIATFPYGKALLSHLETAHFTQLQAIPLSCGMVTIYLGEKA
jgi:demethylmenaquinone methyltransferase / 2-methoxy-6-polyprenyl-1,4-benzoquinol methylase